MSSLLPPNATAQEVALSETTERIDAIPVRARQVWNPQTCPASLLPWLAWALSVDEWNANWTDQQKRDTIAASFRVHSTKGTLAAVKTALLALGYSLEVTEWWQEPVEYEPYTFGVVIDTDGSPLAEDLLIDAATLINETKNTRSHLARLRVITKNEAQVRAAAAAAFGVVYEVYDSLGGSYPNPGGGAYVPPPAGVWAYVLVLLDFDNSGNGTNFLNKRNNDLIPYLGSNQASGGQFAYCMISTDQRGLKLTNQAAIPASFDFTIEFALDRFVAQPGEVAALFYCEQAAEVRFVYDFDRSQFGVFGLTSAAGYDYFPLVNLPSGWRHVALVREANTLRLFFNGVLVGTKTAVQREISNYSLLDGRFGAGRSRVLIDEFRLSKKALYSQNFAPPTEPHPVGDIPTDPEWGQVLALSNFEQWPFVNLKSGAPLPTGNTLRVAGGRFGDYAMGNPSYNGVVYSGLNINTGQDFTFEMWANIASQASGGPVIVYVGVGNPGGWLGYDFDAGAFYAAAFGLGSGSFRLPPSALPVGWFHLAYVRSANVLSVFVNGVKIGQLAGASTEINEIWLLDHQTNGWRFTSARLDEFRVTRGARYLADFAPPTAPFPTR